MSAPLLVANSGPLIALARLDLLALPSRLFGELLVTATVWREVTREPRPTDQTALSAAFDAGLLLVVDDPLPIPAVLLPSPEPIPIKEGVSVIFVERGEIGMLDGAFVVVAATDAPVMQHAWAAGIGPGKAYGMRMLSQSLAPMPRSEVS